MRAEEAATKPVFRGALKKRRCPVPADAFYQSAKHDAKTKQPFAIGLKSVERYAFAGLWESWRPEEALTSKRHRSPIATTSSQ
jgi:putative SOS response-associated peptidase YedK